MMRNLGKFIDNLLVFFKRSCFFVVGLLFVLLLGIKLFYRRIRYSLDLWIFEMRLWYIGRIIFILILFYLPPMEEVDIVWWLFREFFDIFVGIYCLGFFLYYIFFSIFYWVSLACYNWIIVYPWLIEFWSFFTTFWFVKVIILSAFYNELWVARWKIIFYQWWKDFWKWLELKYFLQIGWYFTKRVRYVSFKLRLDLMKDFIAAGTGRRLRDRLRGMYLYGQSKWSESLYKLVLWLKNYESGYLALVVSLWVGFFVIYLGVIFTIIFTLVYKFFVVYVVYYLYLLFVEVLSSCSVILFFFCIFFSKVWNIFMVTFVMLVVFWGSLCVNCGFWVFIKISGVFFLIEYWWTDYISIGMFKEAFIDFGLSSNFFSFFYQGFIYLFQNFVSFIIGIFGYFWFFIRWVDSVFLQFSIYVSIQVFCLTILIFLLDILIGIFEGIVYVGLLAYHVIVLSMMQCLDSIDFNALSVGVGIWVDVYVIILVCWILDYDFRWYIRAVAKPTPFIYRDAFEKSLFLPSVIKYGPARTQVYIGRYLNYMKNRPSESEKYLYYRKSRYFVLSSGDYVELLNWTWTHSWWYLYDFWTGMCNSDSIRRLSFGSFLDLLRWRDFDGYWRVLRHACLPNNYAHIEFEDEDVSQDIELLMNWFIEWYAYEVGTYTEAELYRFVDNHRPLAPLIEFYAYDYEPHGIVFAAFEELDYYYDSMYYPHYPYIYHFDRHSIARYYNCEHVTNYTSHLVFNSVSTLFIMVPLIWVIMFFFGWGTTMYNIDWVYEEFVMKMQYVHLQTYALSSSWFDFLFNWPFLEFFPGLRNLIDATRRWGRTWNWVIWGNRRFMVRRYGRMSTAREFVSFKYEYPWLVRFRLRNRSHMWRYWVGRLHNIGYRLKSDITRRDPKRFKPLYEWNDLSELDALVHFVSLRKGRYEIDEDPIDLYSRWHFSYQFLRNAYKKICRYRNEDFKWLSAWKRFYKALGMEKEDFHFAYEFLKFRGRRTWRLRKRIRKIRNFMDSKASIDYSQLGLIKHYLISDYSLNMNVRSWWRWVFYNMLTRFSGVAQRDYPVPSMNDMRFYASAHYSLYNSWRYLFGYSGRFAYWYDSARSLDGVRYRDVWRRLYNKVWYNDWDSLYDDFIVNDKKYKKVLTYILRERGSKWWRYYRSSSFSFLSGFMFEPFLDPYHSPFYIPRFQLRGGYFLFFKYFRRELLYKYGFEVAVRRTYWEPVRIDAFNLWFYRDFEIRGFDGLYKTIINIYAFMDYEDQKKERDPTAKWYAVDWPIPATEEIYFRRLKSWSGIKNKPVFWSFIGRFPFYRYEHKDYKYYNFIGYSGQRKRWMKRHLVPYFLD